MDASHRLTLGLVHNSFCELLELAFHQCMIVKATISDSFVSISVEW